MTENEAIEYLKELNESYFQPDKQGEFDDVNVAFKVAITALEEIQQYRAFDERLKKIYGDCPGLLEIVIEHLFCRKRNICKRSRNDDSERREAREMSVM